jgi:hypothetical protein
MDVEIWMKSLAEPLWKTKKNSGSARFRYQFSRTPQLPHNGTTDFEREERLVVGVHFSLHPLGIPYTNIPDRFMAG